MDYQKANGYGLTSPAEIAKMAAANSVYGSGLSAGPQVKATVSSQILNLAEDIERLETVISGLAGALSPVTDYSGVVSRNQIGAEPVPPHDHVSSLAYLRDKVDRLVMRVNEIREALTV